MDGLKTGRCPLVLLGVLCLHVGWVLGHWEHTCTLETKNEGARGGLCGSRLPKMLQLICRRYGGTAEKWFRKRSDQDSENRIKNIILGKKEALSYLSKRSASFGEQGITCECCYNRCSFTELLQYCRSSRAVSTSSFGRHHIGRK